MSELSGNLTHSKEAITVAQVAKVDDGLEAVIFTADGDMRQALNNLQVCDVSKGLVSTPDPGPTALDPVRSVTSYGRIDHNGTATLFK